VAAGGRDWQLLALASPTFLLFVFLVSELGCSCEGAPLWVLNACNILCFVLSIATFRTTLRRPGHWFNTLLCVGSLGIAGTTVLVMLGFVAASLPLHL
jgi:hypothetical protein